MSVTWQGQQLGLALQRLSATQDLEFWIDRRVDQQQAINIHLRDVTVDEALEQLTSSLHMGFAPLQRVIYIGPSDAAHEIAGLCQLAIDSLKQAPPAVRRRWLQSGNVAWPRLSVPRQLLRSWLKEAGMRLEKDERIPHDLWPAQRYTSLSLLERVVLLLAGFDQTCRIAPDGRLCTVVPIERPVLYTRTYETSPRQRETLRQVRELFPEAIVAQTDDGLTLRGDWQQHQQLAELVGARHPSQAIRSRAARQVFSLRIENQPLGRVLDQLAQQWQVAIVWAPVLQVRSQDLRATPISCDVHQVPEDEVWRAILEPAGLRFRKSEGRLEILPDK